MSIKKYSNKRFKSLVIDTKVKFVGTTYDELNYITPYLKINNKNKIIYKQLKGNRWKAPLKNAHYEIYLQSYKYV